jgi:hypothetical protein
MSNATRISSSHSCMPEPVPRTDEAAVIRLRRRKPYVSASERRTRDEGARLADNCSCCHRGRRSGCTTTSGDPFSPNMIHPTGVAIAPVASPMMPSVKYGSFCSPARSVEFTARNARRR